LIHLHLRQQTSDALLKLTVLGGVDERVDEAIAEHQYGQEMIIPTGEVDSVADETDRNQELVGSKAYDESAAYHQRSDNSVTSGSVCCGRCIGTNLKRIKLMDVNNR